MSAEAESTSKRIVETVFKHLARSYVRLRKPMIVITAGSVGKTSSKLMLAKLLETERSISYMDDSYNKGLGLYLSIFQQKVPDRSTPLDWVRKMFQAIGYALTHNPRIMVLEYGIDGPGDMREMVEFVRPDVAMLTAVTPEHMEFLKTLDIVGEEEILSITAVKQFGVINVVDVPQKFIDPLTVTWYGYGREDSDATYHIKEWRTSGTVVDFVIDGTRYDGIELSLISEPIIRQLSGALLVAQKLGISAEALQRVMPSLRPASGRMGLFEGVKGSTIIDDTANFSPVAGVAGLQTLKRMPAKRHIGVIGNMHELGDFAEQGYAEVAAEFAGLDILVLVGDLSPKIFGEHAAKAGFIKDKNLFMFDNSPEAGAFMRDTILREGDVVFVKGPFGGFYLEEATKKMLNNPDDARYLTRQSVFWDHKKRQHFGAVLDA